jgi:hypothetical protein
MGVPVTLLKTATGLQCVVTAALTSVQGVQAVHDDVCLIGFSSDKGLHWTFMETRGKSLADIRQTFPDVSPQLAIP